MRLSVTTLSFILIFSLFISAQAQPQPEGQPQLLIDHPELQFQSPVWAPDGSSIAFTSARYQGIWTADASGNNLEQITDESAGFGFSWSMDSESILARISEYDDRRRFHAIKIFHTDGQEPTQLTELRSSMPATPIWANFDEKVVLINSGDVEAFDSGKEIPARFKQSATPSFYVLKQDAIAKGKVPQNSTEDISPFEDATYLSLQVSPDGQKLAFEVYGGNLYSMNIDGSNLVDLGQANRPRWSPDSDYVVASVSEDDGHDYVRSDLYALKIDGTERVNLTSESDLIAMNPSWSPDGSKIVFDAANEGAIYVLNLVQ
ncbi:MAG: hypothetical protein WD016_08795 [Balneolaceae bacterium]